MTVVLEITCKYVDIICMHIYNIYIYVLCTSQITGRPGNRPSRHCDFMFGGFNKNTWRCGFVHFFIMHIMVF